MNVPPSITGNNKFYNTHHYCSYKWSHIYHGCTKFNITLPTNQISYHSGTCPSK